MLIKTESRSFKFNIGDTVKVRDDILDSGYFDDGECVEGWVYEAVRKYNNRFHITKQTAGRISNYYGFEEDESLFDHCLLEADLELVAPVKTHNVTNDELLGLLS